MNEKKFEEAIKKTGLKINFIVSKLGISREAFRKKKKGELKFNDNEKIMICSLLNVGMDIFLP